MSRTFTFTTACKHKGILFLSTASSLLVVPPARELTMALTFGPAGYTFDITAEEVRVDLLQKVARSMGHSPEIVASLAIKEPAVGPGGAS